MANDQVQGQSGYKFSTWAGSHSCSPELYFEPQNVKQVGQILEQARQAGKKVRVAGNGHSPSDLACTDDYMINMKKMNNVLHIDKEKHTVKAEAGITMTALNDTLAENGLGISVQGVVSEVSLAGVITTATHGSGANYGVMSSYVLEMELMLASGDVITVSRDRDEETFLAAAVSMGTLGVILTITLQCEPAFRLQQTRYPAKLDEVLATLDDHVNSSDHFSFSWFNHTDSVIVSHSNRTEHKIMNPPGSWFWNCVVECYLFEILLWLGTIIPCIVPYISSAYFRFLFSARSVRVDRSDRIFTFNTLIHYSMEWAVPRFKAASVIKELEAWTRKSGFKVHFPTEVRFVKGDDLYLSPASGRDVCYVNIIMFRPFNVRTRYEDYWRAYEDIMLRAGGRPHWAKGHSVKSEQFAQMYPRWRDFCGIRRRLDPDGLFLNPCLERLFENEAD